MNKLEKLVSQIMANYYSHQLKKDQWKDPQQLERIQFKKLKAVLNHAYDYVPFYHRLFKFAKIRPDDIRNFEDMRKIPPTSKQDIQQNFLDMLTRGVDTSKLDSCVTSGSTGIPLKVFRDPSFTRAGYHSSVNSYILSECGVRSTDNFVTVWGRDAKSIQWGKKYERLWMGISEIVVPLFPPAELVNILRQIKPDVLNTFPSILSTLANYDISGIRPRIVLTQGELVTQHCRNLVRKMFGLELFETYGCIEFGNLAFDCNEHCGLHVITNSALIEFVDETGEHVSFGEQGEFVVTGFLNYIMPLIRYRIGDMGIPTDEKCACGRSWPIIKGIQGRIDDYLTLPSGKKIPWWYLTRALYGILIKENVFATSQYQIIQDRKDRIVFYLVKGREFNPEILGQIRRSLKREFDELGENIQIVTQFVDDIPMGRTGKRRTFISKIG
ncbi:MAG: phenylacetate--CoA ligase family protein [Candidatus Baldrarchaeia archaeon]